MKVCCKCWNAPCVCKYNDIVDIDDEIYYEVVELNRKGYKTVYCCQGHGGWSIFDMYIKFENKITCEVPKPLTLDRDKRCIRYCKWSDKTTDAEIEYARKVFRQWVDDLPSKTM